MQVKSVETLLKALHEEESSAPEMMFRGQTRDWSLLPGIGRYPQRVSDGYGWRLHHDNMIDDFLHFGRPFFHERPTNDEEAWIHAQHYGLPTRLLDWTTNPLKALFFSVNDTADDSSSGGLWALTYSGFRKDLDEQSRHYWEREITPLLPKQLNPRLIAQEGCFLSYPLPDNCEPLKPANELTVRSDPELRFTKFVVPAKAKDMLRRELNMLGIQYRLLFPDLDGVARGVKLERLESDYCF